MKALIIEPAHPVLLDTLTEMGYTFKLVKQISKAEALEIIADYEGLITSNKLFVDKELIDAGSKLKWIGRMGSGMEIIDVPYAQSKGIVCVSSPEGNANAVAEQALGCLLALKQNIFKSHQELQHDIWRRDENRGDEIANAKVGIIGFGNNGRLFAQKLVALGVTVYAYDPYVQGFGTDDIIECATLEILQNEVEVVSFHVPLNEATANYFNADFYLKMKHPFVLLNLSRGTVVDFEVLERGLEDGKITAAAIDVWPEEPVTQPTSAVYPIFKRLMERTNFIGTAHIGGYTHQATYKMSYFVAQKLKAIH